MAEIEPVNNFETNHRRDDEPDRRRRRHRDPRPQGRYDGRSHNVVRMATQVPPTESGNVDVAIAAVDDPWPMPGSTRTRLSVAVNRRVDLLEQERSHGRIGEAAYQTGRIVQAVLERVGSMGTSNWSGGSRVDAVLAHEKAIIRKVDDAREIRQLLSRITDAIGTVGARMLRRLLAEGQTFATEAAARGRPGPRGESAVAAHFRQLLEDLAEEWAGRGRGARHPGDFYDELAAKAARDA